MRRFHSIQKKLRFKLTEETDIGDGKRWILIAPPGSSETYLLLAKASSIRQESFVGNQTGGRAFLFLHTDNFWCDYQDMKSCGVIYTEEPRGELFGTAVVFEDLYGNQWDLLELKESE